MAIEGGYVVVLVKRVDVADGVATAHLQLRNGTFATVDGPDPLGIEAGEVLLVNIEEDSYKRAPRELWHRDTWVGVVKKIEDDYVIVMSSNGLRKLPRSTSVEYLLGNTVEVDDDEGVVKVLASEAMAFHDLRSDDEIDAEVYRVLDVGGLEFEDFGGQPGILNRARELIELPLYRADLLTEIGARPIKGVLFSGPPGTGKTMLARIIASKAEAAFYQINGSEVLSKWYGESEKVLKAVFEAAAKHDRAIIFFDEIDSLAGHRHSDSHEASRRVVAQLLTSMDGFEPTDHVVVIGTTNRPQDVDAALLRPGRFDWEIEFGPLNESGRRSVLIAGLRGLNAGGELPIDRIAAETPDWSPAELVSLYREAALVAVRDGRSMIMPDDLWVAFERVRVSLSARRQRAASGEARMRDE